MTIVGVTFGLYGFDAVGTISAVVGMALLVFNIHRFGRLGEDV